MKISYLDGPRLRKSLMTACEYARRDRRELNLINVFPVPDGDTGTNLGITLDSIANQLKDGRSRSVGEVAKVAAQGAVMGARGNSGMMMSHFLYGFAVCLEGADRVGVNGFAHALVRGSANLYAALDKPVEGTIVTVIRDAAEVAKASPAKDFTELIEEVLQEARASLARTPELLPVLKEAGVVDAGAKGFVSLLEAVDGLIRGEVGLEEGAESSAEAGTADLHKEEMRATGAAAVEYPSETERYRYCTEALVRGSSLPAQDTLRDALRQMGDSVIVLRAEDVLKVHIHSDDPEAVFAYLGGFGEMVTRKAEDMHAQHAAIRAAGGHHVALARRPTVIVTDSGCDLPPEVVSAHGIHVTPLLLLGGGKTYRDGIDLTAEKFHAMLAEDDKELPTTSQPTPADFLATYRAAAEEGEAIVAVLLGSSLSGTFASGDAAAGMFDDATVIAADSLGASLLEGLMVLTACECAEAGWKPVEIAAQVKHARQSAGMLLCVDDLSRLAASGRVSARQAKLAKLLRMKPILEIGTDGKLSAAGKALGGNRARRTVFRLLEERVPRRAARVRFGIMHVGVPEVVPPVVGEIKHRYGDQVEILSSAATPTLSTHAGLGAWGLAWVADDGRPLAKA